MKILFDEITQGKKYILLMKSGDGYFYCPIDIDDAAPIEQAIARFRDALTIVRDKERFNDRRPAWTP